MDMGKKCYNLKKEQRLEILCLGLKFSFKVNSVNRSVFLNRMDEIFQMDQYCVKIKK